MLRHNRVGVALTRAREPPCSNTRRRSLPGTGGTNEGAHNGRSVCGSIFRARRAHSDATVTIDLTRTHLRSSVTDHGPGWPEPRAPGDSGFPQVTRLATIFGRRSTTTTTLQTTLRTRT